MKTVLDGACKFCGQIRHVEVEANSTDAEIVEAATMQCGCDSAIDYKMTVRGEKKINELFRENYPEAADIMIASLEAIIDENVSKVTVDTGHNVKGILSMKKGVLNVKKDVKLQDDVLVR